MMNPGKFLIEIATESINLLLQPKRYWLGIKKNENSMTGIFMKFFVPGLFLIFVAIVIGDVIFESEYGLLLIDTLIKATRRIMLLLLTFFAATMLLYEVSRKFNIPVGFETARKIVIYSMTPLVLITIVTGIFPFLDVIGILGLYSFYLIYTALITIFEIKPFRNISYMVILFFSILIVYAFIAYILSKLTALIIY